MAKIFRFPDVGEGITEGEIVRWLVKEGDEVKADQPVAEIETDKAIVEMPSPYSGTVLKLHFHEKDIVKVGQVLITIGAKGESPDLVVADDAAVGAAPVPPAEVKPASPGAPVPGTAGRAEGGAIQATPMVRKLAQDVGIDLATVAGTGPQGRITEDDVRAAKARAATESSQTLQTSQQTPQPAPKVKSKYDFYGTLERIPLRGIRRATAKKMHESVSTAAHVTHFDEADAAALAALKDKLAAEAARFGVKLTYLPFIVKALIAAIKLHPTLNSTLDDEEQEIVVKKYYNIGIAVDVPDGLIVPVVKIAEQKTVFDIAGEIKTLAEAAKARTLDMGDLRGGTFSITNVGMIGGEWATPIINYPEVAILATMKIADRVRAVGGTVAVRKTLPLCLSFDHRVIDGAEAARFMNDLKKALEDEALLESAARAAE
jgi:pyruvate dehydrogenase E2 component (dihydrolipoamide acetyltransferase)